MQTLQNYTLRELTAPVGLSLAFFTFVLLLQQFFKAAELLLSAGLSGSTLLSLSWIIIVTLLALTVPMSMLLGVLIGVGRMTNENEILAMRASGISLVGVFRPLVLLALLFSVALAVAGASFFPQLYQRLIDQQKRIQFEVLTNLKPGQFYSNLSPKGGDVTIYFEQRLPAQPGDGPYALRAKNITMRAGGLFDEDAPKGADKKKRKDQSGDASFIAAENALIQADIESGIITIALENGSIMPLSSSNAEDQEHVMVTFSRMVRQIVPADENERDQLDPRLMQFDELYHRAHNPPDASVPKHRVREGGEVERRFTPPWRDFFIARAEFYQRLAMPFSTVAFVLIAIPLAIELRPRAKSVSFVIAMGLIVVYYAMLSWANEVGSSGKDWVGFAMLLPNLVVGGIGIWLFRRSQKP